MQIFYLHGDSPCACFTLMLCAKLPFTSMQNECRIYNWDLQCRWVISHCWSRKKTEPHPSCQWCPSDTELRVRVCSPQPDGIFASQTAVPFLRSAFPERWLWLCALWQSGTGRSICFLKPLCNMMWLICHRICQCLPSFAWCWVGWALGCRLSIYVYLFFFSSVCSFCVCPSPVAVKLKNGRPSVLIFSFKYFQL